ncbi:phospholipid transport system substrate-binding protein [Salinihabitans flavidus]|uniref:Phospholipid transport system substrate-binding protein n=1 Tax=Salinihabitans flavidus TaxID=569882 RepID=A0A1H8RXP1_9RHOB|nr:ABC transporter substrate-binding protein [Salinihabitans flavidus]SEO71221.1 phospholipid transport system substrate-binding protein [Salinihabitans flavidus]
MSNTMTSRRRFLGTTAAAGSVALLLPGMAHALTDARARALIDQVVADINRVISSGQPLSGMIRDFERIFERYADVPIIARSALGPDARGLSGAQLNAYVDAFKGYITRKYGKRFNEFKGGQVTVKDARKVKTFHEVRTTVKLRGEAPFEVNFLVSDRSGRDLFFDMIIEGISLRLSEKEEIGAMLDRRGGNINQLIQDLRNAG